MFQEIISQMSYNANFSFLILLICIATLVMAALPHYNNYKTRIFLFYSQFILIIITIIIFIIAFIKSIL